MYLKVYVFSLSLASKFYSLILIRSFSWIPELASSIKDTSTSALQNALTDIKFGGGGFAITKADDLLCRTGTRNKVCFPVTWSLPTRHQKEDTGILHSICTFTVSHYGQKASGLFDPGSKGTWAENKTPDRNSKNMQFQHVLARPCLLNDG